MRGECNVTGELKEQLDEVLEELEEAAVSKGMSHGEVARAAELDRANVGKLLTRTYREELPRLVSVAKVARVLGFVLKVVLRKRDVQ